MICRLLLLTCALAVATAAHAAPHDRQSDTDYECQLLAAQDLGVRCRVSRRGESFLLVWIDNKPLNDDQAQRQAYQVRQIIDSFMRRGGRYAIGRQLVDGQHQKKLCNYIAGQDRIGCGNWSPADAPDNEWDPIK